MTDDELFVELVWDKLQQGIYVISNESIYDYESGEWICGLKLMGLS